MAPESTSSCSSASDSPESSASSERVSSRCSSSQTSSVSSIRMGWLLREMGTGIERRVLGELLVERALRLAGHGGNDDLHDREQIAFAAPRLREAALAEPQMLPGVRARRHLELHEPARRRQLDRRAEHGLRRRERQIDVKVVTAHAEERMRLEHNVEVEVAVAATVEALAALARNTQTLPVRRTLRDPRLERARHAVRDALLVVFGHAQVELHFGTPIRLVERDVRRDFVVLAAHRPGLPALPRARPAAEALEQVRQIDIVEREVRVAEMLLPIGRR